MNKTVLILIAGIVIVGGLIGYTVLGKSASDGNAKTGDTTTTQQKTVNIAPHDDTGTAPHNDTTAVPHDDTGAAPHND
ncbi:hypothetical protein EPO14_01955 [Patescibacteria group bacterium]|nr:MAG: hypothetical protein EPO14_01955 [Patescibacteria group bacterium]